MDRFSRNGERNEDNQAVYPADPGASIGNLLDLELNGGRFIGSMLRRGLPRLPCLIGPFCSGGPSAMVAHGIRVVGPLERQ